MAGGFVDVVIAEPSPTRYVVYARQSLTRSPEESLSIEFQVEECTKYVEGRGGLLVGTYSDPDTKGWRRHRPGFDAMLTAIRQGRADTVLLYKMSRFARNLIMQEEVVGEIATAGGDVVSITEPHITTSPMIRQIIGAVNENYRRDQSDWLRSTFAARARKGYMHGRPALGYRKEDLRLVVDEPTSQVVRQIWDWALAGAGSIVIRDRLNDQGIPSPRGTSWSNVSVLAILRNPVYAGHVQHRGELVVRDAHPAIVTDDEFAAVQSLVERRAYQRRKAAPSWAEGFVWHACGQRMHLTNHPKGKRQYARFRCHHTFGSTVREETACRIRPASSSSAVVEAGIIADLLSLLGRVIPLDDVVAQMTAAEDDAQRSRATERRAMERRVTDISAQRQRLLDLVLQERVDPALYAEKDDALRAELDTLREALGAAPKPVSPDAVAAQRTHLVDMLQVVPGLVAHDPADLVPILVALDARYIIGSGPPRLVVGDAFTPYVST